MAENRKKTLRVTNNSEPGSSKRITLNPYKEISPGCGAASCENCPGALGIKEGSDRSMVYRNAFSYFRIVAVILVATLIVKEALTLLPV